MSRNPKKWKALSSNVILDHEKLKVIEDTVELPDGTTSTYVRLGAAESQSVIIIAVNAKLQILVQREYSHPPNKVMWQLPGGRMNVGETPEAAARRELAEESGYSAENAEVIGSFYVNNRLSDRKQYIVHCTKLFKHKLREDNDEFIKTYWMQEEKLKAMITEGEFDNINLLAALNIWFHAK